MLCSNTLAGQFGPQHGHSAVEQSAEGAIGYSEFSAYGFVVGTGDIAKHKREAVFLGEAAQYGKDACALFSALSGFGG